HPANAFVMDFLGNVNVFHGRVRNGRAVLGGVEVDYPGPVADDTRAALYVRPHELDIDRHPDGASLPAQVVHVNPAGPVVRVELVSPEFGASVRAEVSPARYAELGLKPGDRVYVAPRRVRVFAPDYAI